MKFAFSQFRNFAISLLLLGAAACKGDPQPVAASGAGFKKLDADQVIVGFEQYITQAGRNNAIVRGDTAFIYEDSSLAKVRNVKLQIFNEQGQLTARLTAQQGDFHTVSRGMIARGNVVLITDGAGQIETEELHYEPDNHRVWSQVPTVQRHNGGVLRGSGFEADDKFINVRVTNARSSGGGLKITF